MSETKTPWLKNYGDVPFHLQYQECSMWEAIEKIVEKYCPDLKDETEEKKDAEDKT